MFMAKYASFAGPIWHKLPATSTKCCIGPVNANDTARLYVTLMCNISFLLNIIVG